MQIRLLETTDYDEVYELWINTPGMGLNDLDDSKEGIEKFIKRNPNTNFVAVIDGKICGVIMSGHDGRRGYIYHMAVLEAFRKKKIGTILLDHVLRALEDEGITKAALVVFADNELGNSFWEAQGFANRSDLTYRNRAIKEMKNIET